MKSLFFLLSASLFCTTAFSQAKHELKGTVTDAGSKISIEGATILNTSTGSTVVSNESGYYYLAGSLILPIRF